MMKATKWDNKGPRRDCLILFEWQDKTREWMQFTFQGADAEPDGEGGWSGNPDQYINEASDMKCYEDGDPYSSTYGQFISSDFTPLAWAEIPEFEG